MKNKNNAGFSLVEVLVAISILGILSAPVCTSLVVATRMNTKTTELMQAQLAVSSAVETLMAEGIDPKVIEAGQSAGVTEYDIVCETKDGVLTKTDRFPDIEVVAEAVEIEGKPGEFYPYYEVTVSMDDPEVSVTTYIRKAGAT